MQIMYHLGNLKDNGNFNVFIVSFLDGLCSLCVETAILYLLRIFSILFYFLIFLFFKLKKF